MGKVSEVEIPDGSGRFYRYEYVDGATLYRGPVGDAPALTEAEFLRLTTEEANALIPSWPKQEDIAAQWNDIKFTKVLYDHGHVQRDYWLPGEAEGARDSEDEKIERDIRRGYLILSNFPLHLEDKYIEMEYDKLPKKVTKDVRQRIIDDIHRKHEKLRRGPDYE